MNPPTWGSFQQIPLRGAATIAAGLICYVTELSHRCGFVREKGEVVGNNIAAGLSCSVHRWFIPNNFQRVEFPRWRLCRFQLAIHGPRPGDSYQIAWFRFSNAVYTNIFKLGIGYKF